MATSSPDDKRSRLLTIVQVVVLAAQILLTGMCYGIYRAIVAHSSSANLSPVDSPLAIVETPINRSRDTADVRAANSDLKEIGLALLMYAQDNDENFPPATTNLAPALSSYLDGKSLTMRPETLKPRFGFGAFVYTFQGGKGPAEGRDTIVAGYKDSAVYGRINLFIDGHTKMEKPHGNRTR